MFVDRLQPDSKLRGDYALLEVMGTPGSEVFRARANDGRSVVLRYWRSETPFAEHSAVEHIDAASGIRHPMLASVDGYVPYADGTLCVVSEFVPGRTLDAWVGDAGVPHPALAVDFVRRLALGLQSAHQRGVTHSALYPGNLIALEPDTRPRGRIVAKLIDLGVPRIMRSAARFEAAHFMAPEALAAELRDLERPIAIDARMNVYSCGCLLHYLCTGQPPHQSESLDHLSAMHASATPVTASRLNPEIPAALDRVIARALELDPERRYDSAADLATALAQVEGRWRESGMRPKASFAETPQPANDGERGTSARIAASVGLVPVVPLARRGERADTARPARTTLAGVQVPAAPLTEPTPQDDWVVEGSELVAGFTVLVDGPQLTAAEPAASARPAPPAPSAPPLSPAETEPTVFLAPPSEPPPSDEPVSPPRARKPTPFPPQTEEAVRRLTVPPPAGAGALTEMFDRRWARAKAIVTTSRMAAVRARDSLTGIELPLRGRSVRPREDAPPGTRPRIFRSRAERRWLLIAAGVTGTAACVSWLTVASRGDVPQAPIRRAPVAAASGAIQRAPEPLVFLPAEPLRNQLNQPQQARLPQQPKSQLAQPVRAARPKPRPKPAPVQESAEVTTLTPANQPESPPSTPEGSPTTTTTSLPTVVQLADVQPAPVPVTVPSASPSPVARALQPSAAPARRPVFRTELLEVRGSLATSVVRRAVERIRPQLYDCYRTNPSPQRPVPAVPARVDLTIDEVGRVHDPRVRSAHSAGFDECVRKVSSKLVSDAPDTGLVKVSFVARYD